MSDPKDDFYPDMTKYNTDVIKELEAQKKELVDKIRAKNAIPVHDPKDDIIALKNERIENLEDEYHTAKQLLTNVEFDRNEWKSRAAFNNKFNSFVGELRFVVCFVFLFGCVTLLLYNALEIKRQTIECQKSL